MKFWIRITAITALILALCFPVSAFAASWGDFTDVSGHWAESAMKAGYDDGLIAGYGASTLAPDAPISGAQMVTILCRVLGASQSSDASKLGISSDTWYYKAAGEALFLGLISDKTGNLDAPASRQDALSMMAKAFCLIPAEPDYSVLGSYSDAGLISSVNRDALAALVSEKLIHGDKGALNVTGSITRAEFLTVLFRIANDYTTAYDFKSSAGERAVLRGSASLSYISAGNIWFDCSAGSVSLSGVRADSVTLRADRLAFLNLANGSEISGLAVDVGAGSVSVGSAGSAKIGTLRLASCDGASIGSDAESVEITGSKIPVSISGKHGDLLISGSGNKITLSSDASFSRIKITGSDNSLDSSGENKSILSCDGLDIRGQGNSLTFGVSSGISDIVAGGSGNTLAMTFAGIASLSIEGSDGKVSAASLSTVGNFSLSGNGNCADISAPTAIPLTVGGSLNVLRANCPGGIGDTSVPGDSNWITLTCSDISSLSISGKYNTVNKYGSGIAMSVKITGSGNAFVLNVDSILNTAKIDGDGNRATVNGTAQTISIGGGRTELDGSGKVASLTINAAGCTVSLAADSVTDNSKKAEEKRVLDLVTTGYSGNYTLRWAQEHDYSDTDKVTWVNAKGYSSGTDYLIWVNLAMQRVNIFQGGAENWKLCYSCIVGTGAPGLGTPVGTWTITYKLMAGWTTDTYTVKPVVGFKQDTGYAFHSRLFYPGTSTLSDASIGYPVSHGCVRMYDEDVKYIYDTIPFGTTVVVY